MTDAPYFRTDSLLLRMTRACELGTLISQSSSSTLPNQPCTVCQHVRHHQIVRSYRRVRNRADRLFAEKWLAMQSLDNQILIYSSDTFKQNRKKRFAGHTVAGYACVPAFSPDGRFISSGDGSGNVHFWDFKSGKKYPNRLQAHRQVVIAQKWLPHETVSSIFALV